MAHKVSVEIVGDSSSLERAFKRSERSATQFQRSMGRTFRGAAAGSGAFRSLGRSVAFASTSFLGGVGLVAAIKSSVEAASNLAEQTSKTSQVFGESGRTVLAWSQTTVKSMGLAEDQALETASSFGALLRPLGLTGSEAAKQSEALTQLGADLASFYNTSVQDALDAIRSGLVGESEPLRRYGVLLSETRVVQEALTETGKKNAAELTNQDKVLARITLTFQDSAQAAGDFQRTSGGLANQLRIFQANVRQLQIELGKQLIPIVLNVVKAMNDWLGKSENQRRVTETLRDVTGALREIIEKLKGAFDLLNSVTGSTKRSLELLFGVFVAFKALSLVSRLTQIADSIGLIGTRATTSRIELERLGKTPLPPGFGAAGTLGAGAAGAALAFGQQGETSPKPSGQLGVTWMADIVAYRDPVTGKYIMVSGKRASSAAEAQKLAEADFHRRHPGATLPGAGGAGAGKAAALPLPTSPLPPGSVPVPHPRQRQQAAAAAKGFTLPLRFQLEQARAEATGVQAQIVKAAHDIAVFIAGIIPKLHGKKLLDAYQQFAQADGVVRDAVRQATEKTKETAAKAKQTAEAAAARAQAEVELARQFSVSLGLQVEQARAQALGRSLRPILKKIRAAAVKALKSGKLGLQGQLDAWNTIADINQQLADHATNTKRVVKAAQFKGFGAVLPTTPSVFGAIVPGTATGFQIHELHLHGVQNVPQLENELLKRSKQRPHARRGP